MNAVNSGDANPCPTVNGGYFHFWICCNLLRHILLFAGLDVEFALKKIHCAERPYPGLITVNSGKVTGSRFLQEIMYCLHGNASSSRMKDNFFARGRDLITRSSLRASPFPEHVLLASKTTGLRPRVYLAPPGRTPLCSDKRLAKSLAMPQ